MLDQGQSLLSIISNNSVVILCGRRTGPGTSVLEWMPFALSLLMFRDEVSLLGRAYANMLLPAARGANMIGDIPAVLELLRANLGQPDAHGKATSEMYRWRGPELRGVSERGQWCRFDCDVLHCVPMGVVIFIDCRRHIRFAKPRRRALHPTRAGEGTLHWSYSFFKAP